MARPPKDKEDLHDRQVRVRFTDAQWIEIQKIARERDAPIAVIAREAAVLGARILRRRQAA
jgi:hypothetical protein